jgi:serine/threonine-protein phosphatase 2A regulatory subunit B'
MPKKDKAPAEEKPKEKEKEKEREKSKHPFLRKSLHLGKSKKKDESDTHVPTLSVTGEPIGAAYGNGLLSGTHLGPPPTFEGIRRIQLESPLMARERSPSSRMHPKHTQQLEKLPPIDACKPSEQQSMLIEKLKQCSVVFNLEDSLVDLKSKEIKREALTQCCAFVRTTPGCLTEPVYDEFFTMFKANIFRVLGPPSVTHGAEYDPEEDEPVLEPAFPHLKLVYDIFLQVIESPDFQTRIASRYIHENFVTNLLDLFNSEDPRERDLLKSTLHRVYGRFLQLRAFIRRSIRDIFLKVVYERPSTFNGIAELLEILGSVINGFTYPIKDEHRHFLLQVLIPLHKVKTLSIHLPQLAYCVVQFIEKDPALTANVVHGLLRIWPRVNSPKEVMFLNEIDEIIEKISYENLCEVKEPLFRQLAQCIGSPHFQVAERALYFWCNEAILQLLQQEAEILMPIVCPTLFKFSKAHWNKSIHQLIFNALKILMDINANVFEHCSKQYQALVQQHAQRNADRAGKWEQLQRIAKKNPISCKFEQHALALSEVDDCFSTAELEEALRSVGRSGTERSSMVNSKLRRKSFLPTDPLVAQALQAHEAQKISSG